MSSPSCIILNMDLTIFLWLATKILFYKDMCSSNKMDMPKSNLTIMWTSIFEQDVVKCRSHNTPKRFVFQWDYIEIKFANHSRLYSQHDWGDIYDHSMSMAIFTSTMNKIIICAPKLWCKWLRAWFGYANHSILRATSHMRRKAMWPLYSKTTHWLKCPRLSKFTSH
jgi:hypothetical protein